MPVHRPILSVGRLQQRGFKVVFESNYAYLWRDDKVFPLYKRGALYYLPVQVLADVKMTNRICPMVVEPRPVPKRVPPYYLFEWCCDPNSRLSNWFHWNGHAALRLALPKFDMSVKRVVDDVVDKIELAWKQGFRIALWISLPCTAWCKLQGSWQHHIALSMVAMLPTMGALETRATIGL